MYQIETLRLSLRLQVFNNISKLTNFLIGIAERIVFVEKGKINRFTAKKGS